MLSPGLMETRSIKGICVGSSLDFSVPHRPPRAGVCRALGNILLRPPPTPAWLHAAAELDSGPPVGTAPLGLGGAGAGAGPAASGGDRLPSGRGCLGTGPLSLGLQVRDSQRVRGTWA